MTQEALKLALEALKWCHGGEPCGTAEAIAAIKEALAQEKDYEHGFVDGMQKQMQSSVDKAVNRMAQTEQAPVADDFFKMIADRNPKPFPLPQRPRVVFPTMLRKMWSGGEVQQWLDENVNKENT